MIVVEKGGVASLGNSCGVRRQAHEPVEEHSQGRLPLYQPSAGRGVNFLDWYCALASGGDTWFERKIIEPTEHKKGVHLEIRSPLQPPNKGLHDEQRPDTRWRLHGRGCCCCYGGTCILAERPPPINAELIVGILRKGGLVFRDDTVALFAFLTDVALERCGEKVEQVFRRRWCRVPRHLLPSRNKKNRANYS